MFNHILACNYSHDQRERRICNHKQLKKNMLVNMLLLNVQQQQKLKSQLQFAVRKDAESETVLFYCVELLSLS